MRRFVFITQAVDPDHPALGATVAKIRAIAERVDEVIALTRVAVPGALPDNCRVVTYDAPSRLQRGLRFETALAHEMRPRPDAVLAHMAPIYAVLVAPLCRPLRVPLLLWFTHWRAGTLLRIAERLSTVVVTVDRRSFPLPSPKVVPTGHGIDLDDFPCVEHGTGNGLHLLSLGRYSHAKGIETVARVVALVPEARLVHHGPALNADEERCRGELEQLVVDLDVGGRIEMGGPVPRREVPGLLAGADALINNMRAGAADKVVYEAAASCLPVLASSPVFETFLPRELRFPRDDPDALAERLRGLAALDRTVVGHRLRERVVSEHSVGTWADRVLAAAGR